MNTITTVIESKFSSILKWLENEKSASSPIIYTSVDIRESSNKITSIDTNVFPAGFNNLCETNHSIIKDSITDFINKNFPSTKNILLFCEDHTRNLFYLENVFQLTRIIENAGFKVTIGTFFNDHPQVCETNGFLDLKTMSEQPFRIYCLNYILKNLSKFNFDICLLNNDLTNGDLSALKKLNLPIVPDVNMGWYKRQKSTHFKTFNQLIDKMIKELKLDIDPWQLSTLFKTESNININNESDRNRLAYTAGELLNEIKAKYNEHKITSAPYLVLKANNGTYGMGVISINSPDEIKSLNRKKRNKLFKGKSSTPIESIIIQEGIPSVKIIDKATSEEVIYNVNGTTVGGFYRMHDAKSDKDILNSKGMQFKAFFKSNSSDINASIIESISVSKTSYIIAQLANLSAQKELSLV